MSGIRALGLWRARRGDDTLPDVYEYPSRRRLSPILIAVLALLAGAAGTSAFLLVGQYLDAQAQTSNPGGNGTTTSPAVVTTTTNTADPCPRITVDAVRRAGRPGNLERVIYVDVTRAGTGGAEAWICRDSDGTLYYQGHNKDGPATAATSDSTILLGGPIKGSVTQNGSTFTAVNPSPGTGLTQYIVSRERLVLVNPDGARLEYTVVRTSP